jgi:hypothetical protein
MADNARQHFGGKEALETIFTIHKALLAAGDNSFPIVRFATEEELAADEALAAQEDLDAGEEP